MPRDRDLDNLRTHEFEATFNLLSGRSNRSFPFFTEYLWALLAEHHYEKAIELAEVLSKFSGDLPDDLSISLQATLHFSSGNSDFVAQLREHEFPAAISELVGAAIGEYAAHQATALAKSWAIIPQSEALRKVVGEPAALNSWYEPAGQDGLLRRRRLPRFETYPPVEVIGNAISQLKA